MDFAAPTSMLEASRGEARLPQDISSAKKDM